MKIKKLLSLFSAAAISASCFAGMAITASAESYTYAVPEGGDAITAGTTIDTVPGVTLTFGTSGEGEAAFNAGKSSTALSEYGFSAFTEGNGVNGNKGTGTCYIFNVAQSGKLDVGVVLNKDKAFYVIDKDDKPSTGSVSGSFDLGDHQSEERELSDQVFNGLKYEQKLNSGIVSFDVKANNTYYVYCAGSKLGFFGFIFTPAPEGPAIKEEAQEAGLFSTHDDAAVLAYNTNPIEFSGDSPNGFNWVIYGPNGQSESVNAIVATEISGDATFGLIIKGNKDNLEKITKVEFVSVE